MSRRIKLASFEILLLVAFGIAIWWTGPHGPIPGGPLSGERVDGPPKSWNAARSEQSLAIESRAGWLPFSTRVFVQVDNDELFIILSSLFGDGMQRRLERNPDIMIELEGKVHAVSTQRVTDAASIGAMTPAFLWKYFALKIEPGDITLASKSGVAFSGAEAWVHRIVPRQ